MPIEADGAEVIGFAWNPMELLREGLASISSAIQEDS